MLRRLITGALVMALTLAWASSAQATSFSTWKTNYMQAHDIHYPAVPDDKTPQASKIIDERAHRTHTIWKAYAAARHAWHLAHLPVPVVPPTAANPPRKVDHWGSGAVQSLIRSIFGSDSARALCTAYRESHFLPWKKNPNSSASGVFQLTQVWWNGKWHFDPFNAYLNIHYAHEMVQAYGWGPWDGGCI